MDNLTNSINSKISKALHNFKYNVNVQKILVVGIIVLSLYITIYFEVKVAALGAILILLMIPLVLSNVKKFLIILIVFKMIINALYNIHIFATINILQIIGGFMPLFLIVYMFIRKIDLKTYPLNQLLIIFLAETILSSIITVYGTHNPMAEAEKILRLLNGITCYFAIPLVFKTKKDISFFLIAWLVSVSFPLLIGLYQIVTGQFHFQVQSVGDVELFRTAALYHDVGTIIFSSIIFILILFFYSDKFKNKSGNSIFYLLLALSSLLIYRTYSRSASIILVVILILFAIYYGKKILLIFSAVVVFGIFFSESSGVYKRIEYDMMARDKWGDQLLFTGRVGMWQRNWDAFVSYKPLNKLIGHETFGAHNDFIRVLLDYGILGLILYVTLLGLILFKLLKALKYVTDIFFKRLIYIAFLSQVGFIINCFSTNPSLYTDYQWFHWGLVGIALVYGRKIKEI